MDQPPSERHRDSAEIAGLSPDMRVGAGHEPDARPASLPYDSAPRPARPSRLPLVLSLAAALVGGLALAASLWVYAETRQEALRLSTEIAQLRVSLDLYGRGNAATASTTSAPDTGLADLASRIAILEQSWRSGAAAATTTAPTPPANVAQGDDCLPAGMRLLVTAGDRYPICGMDANIEIAGVDNGYVTLNDGTIISSGGSMPLPDTTCTISLTSSGDEGITGYGEIRVNC